MRITIRYELSDESGVREQELRPEEYYAPLHPGETYDEGVPKYNSTWQYAKDDGSMILWDELIIEGSRNDRTIRTDYFAHATFMQVSEACGFSELTIITKLSDSKTHIVRVHKSPSSIVWELNADALEANSPGGTQSVTNFLDVEDVNSPVPEQDGAEQEPRSGGVEQP